METLIVVFTY